MPNHTGHCQPKGSWREWTARRKEQKRRAARRFRARHKNDPAYRAYLAAAKAKRKGAMAMLDPNIERERRAELRFRFGRPIVPYTVHRLAEQLPTFIITSPNHPRVFETWETPDQLEARVRAGQVLAGALIES
jgi:hypothetical protein